MSFISAQGETINTQYRIGSIRVIGNVSIKTEQILEKVRSRVGNLFDAETADSDLERIRGLAGVLSVRYNKTVVDNKVALTFVVVEKNIVRSIGFAGNRSFKAKTLRKKLGFKITDYLDLLSAESGRATLKEFYLKKGFAFVQVSLDSEQLRRGKLIYKIEEGPRVKIKSVRFSGNKAIKTGTLKRAIKTDGKKWFLWPKDYTEESVSKDIAMLQKLYYRRGFLNSNIKVKREFNAKKNRIRLTFVIDEGLVYTVDKIIIDGMRYFDVRQIKSKLKLREGRTYGEDRASSDVKQLLKLYREEGFINVQVKQIRRFISKDKVDAEFKITEGEQFRIGRIDITGNEQTQDKIVRRILDEYDFQPGKWYNSDVARGNGRGELERDIQRRVLTKKTTITPIGEKPGQKNAEVHIEEDLTGWVSPGVGVSSDSGLIGQLAFEQRNFDIKDWPKSFSDFITGRAFKGAGQSLKISLEPGTQVSRYLVDFKEPYFRDKPIALDVSGSSWERDRESYDEGRLKAYVGFAERYQKRYRERWLKNIGFRLENVHVGSVDNDAPKEIVEDEGDNLLAGVRFGIRRDLTDDRVNPSRGYIFSTGYEQVGGDHTFGILSGTHRWYHTLYEDLTERKTILATKLHISTILGDAPSFEKFYAGGSGFYGIRGFDYRGVSTRGLQRNVPNPRRKDPVGSNWIFLASTEVAVPLVREDISWLFFVDSGAVDSGSYRASVGTGIQIKIPWLFGPVPMRFEIAAPIMKESEDDTRIFSFSMGRLF